MKARCSPQLTGSRAIRKGATSRRWSGRSQSYANGPSAAPIAKAPPATSTQPPAGPSGAGRGRRSGGA